MARVYSQQCAYVLTDAEAARNNMRAVIKVIRTSALDAEGGHKGRYAGVTTVARQWRN